MPRSAAGGLKHRDKRHGAGAVALPWRDNARDIDDRQASGASAQI